ncbi:hypothetical protein AB0I45_00775 [Brevibacterium sp. NPDC049920]|uniref:hypothetical protein n=1 Tax=Brevibacterium sp. NPDC049920 TaxID=3155279 RepID=UPI00340C5B8B
MSASPKRIELPALFRSTDRAEHGLSRYQLTHSRGATRIHRGVYEDAGRSSVVNAPRWAGPTWVEVRQRLAALQTVRPDAIGSHTTAALLLGLPTPYGSEALLHVTVPHGTRPLRRPGVVGHESRHLEPRGHCGVHINRGDLVVHELAGHLPAGDLVAVFDALLGTWQDTPDLTVDELRSLLTGRRRYRGRRTALDALARARAGVRSPGETRTRLAIVAAGLPEPEVAPAVRLPSLPAVIHPDMAYVGPRIAIEYEGPQHRLDESQWDRDIERYGALVRHGWIVIRITRRTSAARFCREVREALELRAVPV